eukprot:7765912-Ditylum_brightwellii.AAC.1
MEKGPDRGYFLEPDKLIHICDSPTDLDATKAAFEAEGIHLNYHDGYQYVGGVVGGEDKRNEWVKPQVEAWAQA